MRDAIDLNLLCAQSRERLTEALGSGVHLKIEVTSAPCKVPVARDELEQLLLALVLSARRAMPDASVLTIRLSSVVEVPPGLRPPHIRAKPFARITVSDGSGAQVTADLPCVEPDEDAD